MSKFNKETIENLADKLLIGLTEEEKDMIVDEFECIDESMTSVTLIPNIETVEPMTHTLDDFVYELREDNPEDSIPIEELLQNSDDEDGNEIIVPKVVG